MSGFDPGRIDQVVVMLPAPPDSVWSEEAARNFVGQVAPVTVDLPELTYWEAHGRVIYAECAEAGTMMRLTIDLG